MGQPKLGQIFNCPTHINMQPQTTNSLLPELHSRFPKLSPGKNTLAFPPWRFPRSTAAALTATSETHPPRATPTRTGPSIPHSIGGFLFRGIARASRERACASYTRPGIQQTPPGKTGRRAPVGRRPMTSRDNCYAFPCEAGTFRNSWCTGPNGDCRPFFQLGGTERERNIRNGLEVRTRAVTSRLRLLEWELLLKKLFHFEFSNKKRSIRFESRKEGSDVTSVIGWQ